MEEYRSIITQFVGKNKNVPEIQFVVENSEQFLMKLLAGGSSNVVILVTSHDGKQKFVYKTAPETVVNFVEVALTPRRIDIDCYSLIKFNELYPNSTPHIFCLDTDSHAMAQEYMEGMEPMTIHMNQQRRVDIEVAKRLGEIIGVVHKGTWMKNMSPADAQGMKDKFIIDEITEVKIDFDFTRGLDEDFNMKYIEPEALESFKDLKKDGSLSCHKDVLVDMIRNKQQCLVHNDYYPGSVMVKGLDVKVFDMEFASITAAGADTGLMSSFYIMGYVRSVMEGEPDVAALYLAGSLAFLEAYMQQMEDVLPTQEDKKEMVEDTSLFCGWFLLSMTTFKDAHFHMTLSAKVKIVLWRIGKILLNQAKDLTSMKDYVNLFEKSCKGLTSG